jgi:hypothetical protein
MSVARHRHASVDFDRNQESHIFSIGHVGLGQDSALDPGLRIRLTDTDGGKARCGAQRAANFLRDNIDPSLNSDREEA